MRTYSAITCHSDRETLDLLSALGESLPITGILDEGTSITYYFEDGGSPPGIEALIRSWLPPGAAARIERTNVDEQNWNAEFESSLAPIRIADNIIVTQSWNPEPDRHPEDLVIVIDPKMSFGTGHHESTRLIARLLDRTELAGRRVLDLGTGTGVLAIIAAKRHAHFVRAVDNNEWSVENTRENLAANDCTNIALTLGELDGVDDGAFDVIAANIHRNVILELLPELTSRLSARPDACLLTSGILVDDHDSVVDAAATVGLIVDESEVENEWIATRWRRAPGHEHA